MDGTSSVLVRRFGIVAITGFLVTTSSTGAWSNENCRRLEDLARQYAGVQLTSTQKQMKQKMVAWYNKNCGRTRSADIRR